MVKNSGQLRREATERKEQEKDALPPPETLAQWIATISESAERLSKSGLNRKAIVALIHDDTRMPKRDIIKVLTSLASLQKLYCGK